MKYTNARKSSQSKGPTSEPKHHPYIIQSYPSLLGVVSLGHGVKGTSVLEPLDLRRVVGVCQLDLESLTLLWVNLHSHWLADGDVGADEVNLGRVSTVTRMDLICKCLPCRMAGSCRSRLG